ncbi:hypothetical protein SAMN05216359_101521 [Roseateles sp. YR242]|nr:hypothetical protein SAMN05216359_101521 [Roseateles sp. YR242]
MPFQYPPLPLWGAVKYGEGARRDPFRRRRLPYQMPVGFNPTLFFTLFNRHFP